MRCSSGGRGLPRSDPGRAGDPEPGRGRGGQAGASGIPDVPRPRGRSEEAGDAGKAQEPSPAAGGRAEGANAGREPGSLGRRGAGRKAPPGGNGAGSETTDGGKTNIKDYYLPGKNSLVYSEEGRGQ